MYINNVTYRHQQNINIVNLKNECNFHNLMAICNQSGVIKEIMKSRLLLCKYQNTHSVSLRNCTSRTELLYRGQLHSVEGSIIIMCILCELNINISADFFE